MNILHNHKTMSDTRKKTEILGQNSDPVKLLQDLDAIDTDQKKLNYLRTLFIEEADVDDYLQYLDTDEDIDLTRKQIIRLKGTLEGFKVYLKETYLPITGKIIKRFDERLQENVNKLANPDLTPEEVDKIANTRKIIAHALRIAKAPRGAKGKNLRDVTQEKSVTSVAESKKELSPEEEKILLATVKARFEKNMGRHKRIEWVKVQTKLEASHEKMWSLNDMERTGGEPDVVGYDKKTDEYIFYDCSSESPKGRRDIVYDKEAQDWLEKNYPQEKCNGNAVEMAMSMGIEILTEEQTRELQKLGNFDLNTWSYVKTPVGIRKTGAALCGYRRLSVVNLSQHSAYVPGDDLAFRGALRV